MKLKPLKIDATLEDGSTCDGVFCIKERKIKGKTIHYIVPITGNPSEKDVYFLVYDNNVASYFITDSINVWECVEEDNADWPAPGSPYTCTIAEIKDRDEPIITFMTVITGGRIGPILHHSILEAAKRYSNE